MTKLSGIQLFSILFSVKAFGLICSGISADSCAMAGAAVSFILQFLIAIPMLILYSKPGFSLKKEFLLNKAGKAIYAAFFIIWGAVSFDNLWDVSKSVYFPVESSLACFIVTAAVCLYCASFKPDALARSSLITAGIFIFTLFILILGAYSKADLKNYIPVHSVFQVPLSTIRHFCSGGETVMLFMLLEYAPKKRKGVFAFFIGSFIVTELVYLIEIVVLGRIIVLTDLPFFTAGAFSQPLSIQRADSVYMIAFTLLCVITVTLQLILSSTLIKEILPGLKFNSLFAVVLMLSLSALISYTGKDISGILGLLTIILSAVVPIIMLIERMYRQKACRQKA